MTDRIFQVGDIVSWFQEEMGEYEAIVVGLIDSETCLLHWTHEDKPRKCDFEFLVLSDCFSDFQDKINDRIILGPKLDQ